MTIYEGVQVDHVSGYEAEVPEMDIEYIDEKNRFYSIKDQRLESWNIEMKEVYPFRISKTESKGFGKQNTLAQLNYKVLFHHLRDNVIMDNDVYEVDAITHSPIITMAEDGKVQDNPLMELFFFRTLLISDFEYKDGEIEYLPIRDTDVLFYPITKALEGIQVVDAANMIEILCGENTDLDDEVKDEMREFIKSIYANAVEESRRIFVGKTIPECIECIDKITYCRNRNANQ